MNAATLAAIAAALIAISGLWLDHRSLRVVRRAQLELADARAHLDWWQRAAINFADRNRTLRRQLAAADNTTRGW